MKPGKPLAFGRIGAMPHLGLPGNPVSSLVSFDLLARPAWRKAAELVFGANGDLDGHGLGPQAVADHPHEPQEEDAGVGDQAQGQRGAV